MTKQEILARMVAKQGDAHREFHARMREIAALPGYDLDGETSVKYGLNVFQRLSQAMKRCQAYDELLAMFEGHYPNEPMPEVFTGPHPDSETTFGEKPHTVTELDLEGDDS
jgi:hypothetical protein